MPSNHGFRKPTAGGGGGDITEHVEFLARCLMQKQEGAAAEELDRTMAISHRVSRVPGHLRDNNAEAYTPGFVAIGPLHNRDDRRLCPAERLKVAYLNRLISRGHPDPASHLVVIQDYIRLVASREQEARDMYFEEDVVHISSDGFILMMVLDGCFIIEHLINVATQDEELSLHATPFGPEQLSVDLILAENQMPFFLLVDLIANTKLPEFEATGFTSPELLMKLVLYYLAGEKGRDMSNVADLLPTAERVSHVLHLLHEMMIAARTRWDLPSHILYGGTAQEAWRLLRGFPSVVVAPLLHLIVPEGRRRRVREDVPSASDMKQMRLGFKKAYGEARKPPTRGIAAIASVMGPVPLAVKLHGDHDLLQLPQLWIESRTAPLLLNLMAFEQSAMASMKTPPDVSGYVWFMAKMVLTAEDVGLLLVAEVVQQRGNESIEEVIRFFRMVGAATSRELLETSYLATTVEMLRERSQSWTYVERNYYTFLAEFVALVTFVSSISTILQTYAAFKYH